MGAGSKRWLLRVGIALAVDVGRGAEGDGTGRDVVGNDATGSDDGTASNADSGQNRDMRAKPCFIFDDDGVGGHWLAFYGTARGRAMVAVGNEAMWPDHHVAPDADPLMGVKNGVTVDVSPVANLDFIASWVAAAEEHDASIQCAAVQCDVAPVA